MKKIITNCAHRVCLAVLFLTICFASGCVGVAKPYVVDSKQAKEANRLLHSEEPELEFPNPHTEAQWFPNASFGLFMHWGIHSVAGLQPSWAMLKDCDWGYVPEYEGMKYYGLAKRFNPANYDPDKWMAAAKKAGMRYAVLTAKHHDGYALWPSKYGNMSTRQYAGGRDLLKPYVEACRKYGLKVGFYFSPRDWYYPGYPMEAWNYDFNNFRKKTPPPIPGLEENRKNFENFYAYTIGQIRELLTRYGKIDVLWLDGQTWYGIDDHRTKQTLAWIRHLQPGIVINDRWSSKRIGDFETPERNLPKERPEGWWENCRSVNGHWGYNPNGIFWPAANMLERLVRARSWGGNFLMNVGPAPDGTMPQGFYERCGELAEWMAHSGESAIGAGPSPGDDRSNVPVTTGENIWYLHVLAEHKGHIEVRDVTIPGNVELLRTGECVSYTRDGGNLIIELPDEKRTGLVDVIALYWNNQGLENPKADLAGKQKQIEALRDARKKLAHRKRRIIVNDDGNQMVYSLREATREAFLKVRTSGLEGTGVDTICYCSFSSGFGMFTHNTRVGEIFDCKASPAGSHVEGGFVRNKTADFIAQGTDCLEMQVDFCHKNGIEIFWSMRMSDCHDGGAAPLAPYGIPQLKRDHPDWLIWTNPDDIVHVRELLMYEKRCVDARVPVNFRSPEWQWVIDNWPKCGSWIAVNYARPEIRDLAFRYFEEVCENYDVDGIELDFFRSPLFFATHAWGKDVSQDECDMMTDMVRRIRKMTERVGLERGRPILVTVRVPDSVGWCRAIGLDIERWMKQGLIDMLVPSGLFHLNPWEVSVELGHKYDVPVYPCLSDSRVQGQEARKVRKSLQCYRARAMNVWDSGADGVYLFNYGDVNSPLWNELGDPKVLETTNKVYCTGARGFDQLDTWIVNGRRFVNRQFLAPEQPVRLQPGKTETVELRVGQDLLSRQAEGIVPDVTLRLQVEDLNNVEDMSVKLNDKRLTGRIISDSWLEYPVNPAVVKKGLNNFEFMLKAGGKADVILDDLLLWVRYDKSQADNAVHSRQQLQALRQARKKLAHHKRRIIFNNDGNDCKKADTKEPRTAETFLKQRTTPLAGSQVDTIFYCTGVFNLYTHHSKETELNVNEPGDWAWQLGEKGPDSLNLMVDFGHQNGMEVFWSMRMNDTHDSSDDREYLFCRWKKEHPEYLMGKKGQKFYSGPRRWSAVNYAIPQVRDKVFRILKDVCTRYDVDGVELDFFRHPVYFKPQMYGKEVTNEHCDMMTSLLRRVREMTEQVGLERGRSILVSVRVPDSVEYCKAIGLDIERWMQDESIDMMAVSGYFRLNPWQVSIELGHKYNVPVYPCLSESRLWKTKGLTQAESEELMELHLSHECYRGRAAKAWAAGADGIYLFNYANPHSRLWHQLGDPDLLASLDKFYCVNVRGFRRANTWVFKGKRFSNRPELSVESPVALQPGQIKTTELRVGQDLQKIQPEGIVPDVTLRLQVEDLNNVEDMSVKLNDKLLTGGTKSGDMLEYPVNPAVVKKGLNNFEFMLKADGKADVIVDDLLLWVRYDKSQADNAVHSRQQLQALRQARKKLAHRKRRIIFNNDGDDVLRCGKATPDAFLKLRTKGLVGTHVDTICYNTMMCFGECKHNTKVGTVFDTKIIPPTDPQKLGYSRSVVADFREQGTDCLEIMTNFCHENGIEIFWSMRMNDIHDGWGDWYSEYEFPQLKKDHPQWLLGSKDNPPKRGLWTAVDYGQPEIRDLAFRFVQEVCENYDVDGVELDFFRHLNYFRGPASGKDASGQERDMMTDLIRRIRKMTERVALERGRPILVAVRVPDSVDYSRAVGLDLVRWMREGLIDIMTVTGYFRFNPWSVSAGIGHGYDVPVYACLSESRMWKVRRVRNQNRSETVRAIRNSLECYRARAMNVWDSGADGVYMFNLSDPNSPLWNQLGDPNVIETMDKMYCTGARGVGGSDGWLADRLRFLNRSPLSPERPRTLKPAEPETVELRVGQDLLSKQAERIVPDVTLQLRVEKLDNVEDISVKLNDKLLTSGTKSGDLLEYPVKPAVVKKGLNNFEFMLKADGKAEVVLDDLLLWVRYDKNKLQTDNTEHNQQQLERLRKARKKMAHRRRRIIVNDDGNRVVFQLKEASAEQLVAPMKAGFVGTQIDTLYYCTKSSGFGLFTHNTKTGEVFDVTDIPENANNVYGFSRNRVREFIEQGTDVLEIMTDFCHRNNIEIFWSMRMNDTHDADEETWNCSRNFPQLKMEHPEWLMGTKENKPPRGAWTAVDYGQPEIRDLAFQYVEEVCENYDVDGVDLDFFRHAPYFRSHAAGDDASEKDCDMMTGLLRRIRKMTEREGIKRGKPILVSVRVPDSVGFCKAMGLDIERWLAEDLIDVLVVTGYFRLNRWEYSIELGHKYGVPVYPCLSESRIRIGESGRVRSRTSSGVECYRGRAMNAWNSGADGVYIFNLLDPNSPLWNEIGRPQTLGKLDKLYPVKARSTSGANGWVNKGWSRFLNRPWWGPRFPLPLRQGEVIIFYIDVGEDIGRHLAEGTVPDVKMRLHVKNVPGAKDLTVVLNDHELQNIPLSSSIDADGWFEYNVDPAAVVKGANRIKLTLRHCGAKNPALADALLWVRYSNNKSQGQ